jgi:hypothetical protein
LSPIQALREDFSSFSRVGVPDKCVQAVSSAAQEPSQGKTDIEKSFDTWRASDTMK